MTEKRFTVRMDGIVSDALDDLATVRGVSKNIVVNRLVMDELERAIAAKEIQPLINANVITKEQREQLEEVIDVTTKLTGKSRAEVIQQLFTAQNKRNGYE